MQQSISELIATAPPREARSFSGAWIAFVRRYMDARPSTTSPQYSEWSRFYSAELLKESHAQPTARSPEHFFRFKVGWEVRKFCKQFPWITRAAREDLRQGLFVELLESGIDLGRERGELSSFIATVAERYLSKEIRSHMSTVKGPARGELPEVVYDENLTQHGPSVEELAIAKIAVDGMDPQALAATIKRQKI